MSAFVVSAATVDILVSAALQGPHNYRGLVWYASDTPYSIEGTTARAEVRSAGDVGAMLWAENRRSVDHRYRESELEPVYEHRMIFGHVKPEHALSALTCYRYQSCEHPDWRDSEAFAFCEALEAKVVRQLTTDAPWDWTDADLAANGYRNTRSVHRLI